MSDIKIFVSHRIDTDSETIDNSLYVPVRCGAFFDKREKVSMLGDDTGDNISTKKDTFCELTVQYWAWKNVKADYYGMCHYRRFLSFSENRFSISDDNKSQTGLIYTPDFKSCIEDHNLFNHKAMSKTIESSDAVFLEPYDIRRSGHFSVKSMFINDIQNFDIEALELTLQIIKVKYPNMLQYTEKYFEQPLTSFYNLFIMKSDVFNDYCTFLFEVLFELEKRLDIKHYSSAKRRMVGYISEHLLNVYIIKLNDEKCKLQFLQGVFVDSVTKNEPLKPAFESNNNAIVFSSSDFFCPYLGVALESLVTSSSSSQNYDIIVLEKEISKTTKERLYTVIANHSNISLRFVNVKNLVHTATFFLPENNKELSEETYYTLTVPWVLENYSKAVVLDCDIIIKRDIADLYNLNLGDNYIGAAKEYLYHAFLNNPFVNVEGSLTKYCRNDLGLKDEYDYFNAGVLLLNLNIYRHKFKLKELLEDVSGNSYLIVEQDLLNKICCGKVLDIGYEWNFMACISDETKCQISLVSESEQIIYEEASRSPYILHYITQDKPWKYPELKYADEWWIYAKRTIFYEIFLYRMSKNCSTGAVKSIEPAIQDLQRFAGFLQPYPSSRFHRFADKCLPLNSRRRKFAKMLIPRGSLHWKFCRSIYNLFRRKK